MRLATIVAFSMTSIAAFVARAEPVQTAATAVPPLQFGQRGQIVTSAGIGLSGFYESFQSGSAFDVQLSPGLDWFVVDNLSIGGAVSFSYSGNRSNEPSSTSSNTLGVSIGPRIGYNIPLSRNLSFWPRVSLLVGFENQQETPAAISISTRFVNVTPTLTLPFEIHLVPHVVMGIGPYIELFDDVLLASSVPLNPNPSQLGWAIGLSTSIAGYF